MKSEELPPLPPLPPRGPLARKLASPLVQVIIISFICFCTPGIFNANSGMGGGYALFSDAAYAEPGRNLSKRSAELASFSAEGSSTRKPPTMPTLPYTARSPSLVSQPAES